ncbi:unnamed protein product [Urochloa humidicola]
MAVTGTSVAAAATMLAAAAAIFITFVLCFYLFLCAKRYRGAAPTIGGGGGEGRARARFVFAGAGCHGGGGGMDEAAIAALPRKEVAAGDAPADCAVCIAEVAAGEAARVLPRCGHAFHVECVDMWLRSHSTCPLCRCAVADEAVPAPRAPEVDPESPNFPTNVLFFGSQDAVSTRGAAVAPSEPPPQAAPAAPAQAPQLIPGPMAGVAAVVEAARVAALRRLLGCGGGAAPAPVTPAQQGQQDRDLEAGIGGGESSGSPTPAKPQ